MLRLLDPCPITWYYVSGVTRDDLDPDAESDTGCVALCDICFEQIDNGTDDIEGHAQSGSWDDICACCGESAESLAAYAEEMRRPVSLDDFIDWRRL